MSNSNHNRLFAGTIAKLTALSAFSAVLVAFLIVDVAAAQDTDDQWDDVVVKKLATDLEETLQAAYKSSLKAPPQRTALQQRERDAAQGAIRRSRDLSVDYARRMRAGSSPVASEPYFQAVVDEVAYIFETAGDAVPSKSAEPLIDRLHLILDQLQAQYDVAEGMD
jgi:hypothetical protein